MANPDKGLAARAGTPSLEPILPRSLNRIHAGFVVAALLLCGMFWTLDQGWRQLTETSGRMAHAQEILSHVEATLEGVTQADPGQHESRAAHADEHHPRVHRHPADAVARTIERRSGKAAQDGSVKRQASARPHQRSKIECESEFGKGSRFTVLIPQARAGSLVDTATTRLPRRCLLAHQFQGREWIPCRQRRARRLR